MRLIRRLTIIVFIVTCIYWGKSLYDTYKTEDRTQPEMSIQNADAVLQVSVNATEEELKAGVTAYDKKDGDLTNKITVESISKFLSDKVCRVTYTVADSDNHVSKISRKVEFTDYVSPQFSLTRQLQLYVGEDVDITEIIGARDCYDNKDIEGDISNKVKLLSSSVSTVMAGEYTITAQVTNSLGDTSQLQALVTVRQKNNLEPTIDLTKNIVYISKGSKFDEMDYVGSATTSSNQEIDISKVVVEKTSVDTETPGFYAVTYSVQDESERTGYALLTVVVTE